MRQQKLYVSRYIFPWTPCIPVPHAAILLCAMGYDLIIVGCGNAACAFLAKYLSSPRAENKRIVVIEEGKDFFEVSDLAHQRNWLKSFSEGNIFKLRNAVTEDGTPILTARGCCVGGGGSINYTMIAEESQWLAKHLGRDAPYWDEQKRELHALFDLLPPTKSAVTQRVLEATTMVGYKPNGSETGNVPNFTYVDDTDVECTNNRLVHRFPTPFNRFGQRTHSGASIVDFVKSRVELRTRTVVTELKFEKVSNSIPAHCTSVNTINLDTEEKTVIHLKEGGKVVLCAGSATPHLLLPHKRILGDNNLGANVSDHVLIPLGVYILDNDMPLTDRDFYVPVFATGEWTAPSGRKQVYGFDFHAGVLDKLWFIFGHLFLGFLFPNWFKRYLIRSEALFRLVTNLIRGLMHVLTIITFFLVGLFNLARGRPWNSRLKLIVATLKYQAAYPGKYSTDKNPKIVLGWFKDDEDGFCQDAQIAKDIIKRNFPMLNMLGRKPPWIVRKLVGLVVGIPYSEKDVDEYVDKYRKAYLLSQLHLAGGSVVDRGDDNVRRTGLVKGASNVHVADLSSVPLPRVSPQMTAYLVGFHVATALTTDEKEENRLVS